MTLTADTAAGVLLKVAGRPAPQGSKKAFRNRRSGKVAMVEMSKYVGPWREQVEAAAAVLVAGDRSRFPLEGPLGVDMVFSLERPKSHYGTGRNSGVLKASAAALRPTGPPDLSKLARSTEDALTSAGLWSDDARVVEYGRLAKIYAGSGDPDALAVPGAVIRVRRLGGSR